MEPEESRALREELLKQLGEGKLEELVREKEEKFHGLLTREAAMFAISKEMNLQAPQKPIPVSKMGPGIKRAIILVKVNRIFEVKRYEKNGKEGRVCRVFVGDESSERALVLWNDDVDYVELGKILKGDLIEARGIYMKGDELALGYGGSISVLERQPEKKLTELSEGEAVNITASVSEYSGLRRYEREGSIHEMASCTLEDSSGKMRLVLWEPNERALEGAKSSDLVRIEDARFKNGEIQASRSSKVILMAKPIPPGQLTADFEGEVEGKIEAIIASGEGLELKLEGGGEGAVLLSKTLSLRLLGLKSLPEDVALETLLKLKGGALAGSSIRARGKTRPDGGRLLLIADKLLS